MILGKGKQGTVYDYGEYAVKVTATPPNTRILRRASDAGVSPRYHGTVLHRGQYYTYHDKLPTKFRPEFANQIPELLTRTLEVGIFHGDVCTCNMMADASGSLKLIDFDDATWVHTEHHLRNHVQNLAYRNNGADIRIVLSSSQLARVYNVNQ